MVEQQDDDNEHRRADHAVYKHIVHSIECLLALLSGGEHAVVARPAHDSANSGGADELTELLAGSYNALDSGRSANTGLPLAVLYNVSNHGVHHCILTRQTDTAQFCGAHCILTRQTDTAQLCGAHLHSDSAFGYQNLIILVIGTVRNNGLYTKIGCANYFTS